MIQVENQIPFLCHFSNLLDGPAAVTLTLYGIKTTCPKGLSKVCRNYLIGVDVEFRFFFNSRVGFRVRTMSEEISTSAAVSASPHFKSVCGT